MPVKVQQVLHGYDRGHRLLAASTTLPRVASSQLSVLSDLSGSAGGDSFEPYLTGYPVMGTDLFALARTWHAPEMRRPGCVWTHTLLLDPTVLEAADLTALLARFRYPSEAARGDFKTPLEIEGMGSPKGLEPPSLGEATKDVIESLLVSIYQASPPDTGVVLPCSGKEMELVAIRLWSQQWPLLRRGFSFCTRAFDCRLLGDRPLDLQLAPVEHYRRARWAKHSVQVLTGDDRLQEKPRWVGAAALDLGSPGAFRKVLWHAGAGFGDQRHAFRPAAEIATLAIDTKKDRRAYSRLTKKITSAFPEADDGRELKALVYGPPTEKSGMPDLNEAEILTQIVCAGPSFDWDQLEIATRVVSAHHLHGRAADELVRNALDQDQGRKAASTFAQGLSPEAIAGLSGSGDTLLTLVESNVGLLQSPAIWKEAGKWRVTSRLVEIARREMNSSIASKIAWAIVDSSALSPDAAFSVLGTNLADALLAAPPETPLDRQTLARWGAGLGRFPKIIEKRTKSEATLTASGTELLADGMVASGRIHPLNPKVFVLHQFPQPTSLADATLGLLFVSGTDGDHPDLGLTELSFCELHGRLAKNRLAREVWNALRPSFPSTLWDLWDRCSQVRSALTKAFVAGGWTVGELLSVAGNNELFGLVAASVGQSPSGRRRIREVLEGPEAQRLSRAQLKSLRDSIGWS